MQKIIGRWWTALAAQCGFNPILAEALRAFLAVLDSYTLADVLEHEGGRTALLGGLYGGSGACPQ